MLIKGYFDNMDNYIDREYKTICQYKKDNNINRLVFRIIHNEQFYIKEIEGENWGINVAEVFENIIPDICKVNNSLDYLENLGYITQNIIPRKQFGYKCPVYSAHRRTRLTKKGWQLVPKLDLLYG